MCSLYLFIFNFPLYPFLELRTFARIVVCVCCCLPIDRLLPRASSQLDSLANCGRMSFNYILRIRTSTAWPQFNYFIRAKRPGRQLL